MDGRLFPASRAALLISVGGKDSFGMEYRVDLLSLSFTC